jgi:hypothetical protein
MPKYKVRIELERIVEAKDEYEASENFWIELEQDNGAENTTTDNRLGESMTVEEIK